MLADSSLFEKFMEFNPALDKRSAKKEFSKQVDELFFARVEKDLPTR